MATVECGDPEVIGILAAAIAKYPDICTLVNEVVYEMNTVEVMKAIPDCNCDIQHAGTNIKSCESILNSKKDVDDVIRFRIISSVQKYTENYTSFSRIIQGRSDVSHIRTKFFTGDDGNPYVGINIKYTYKDYPFEVQFHTTQSSELAKYLHPIYKSKERLSIDDTTADAIKTAKETADAIKTIKYAETETKSGKSRYKSRRKRKRKRKTYRKRSK